MCPQKPAIVLFAGGGAVPSLELALTGNDHVRGLSAITLSVFVSAGDARMIGDERRGVCVRVRVCLVS